MKTESHSINDVLAKNATSFFIPPFQRAYAWGKPEIERYFSDVSRIIESHLDSKQHDKLEHFFGTVVIKEEKAGFANKSVVVDGQQRLTTTLIFLIALRDTETDPVKQDFINQNYLTNNSSSFQDKIKLKQVTKDWDAYKTKALTKLGEWQECFDLSKEALEKIENFHYSNDIWFSRRVALSKRNLGNTEDTIQELQTILKKKREWFIQKELAELYFEKGNIESALKQATDAINNFGPLEFKIDLLYLLGKILRQQDKLELSFQHFSLSKLIRQAEEWKLPQKLFDELRTFTFSEIPQTDFKKLKNELQKYWDSFKASQTKTFDKSKTATSNSNEGEIVRILHDNERGKVGFLKSNGKEHYFSVNPNFHSISKIAVGTKVVFEIKPATDDKKEQTRIKKVIE